MKAMRVAAVVTIVAAVAAGCGGGAGAKSDGGGAGSGGGGGGKTGGAGAQAGVGGASTDAAADAVLDVATDFGVGATDVAINCPIQPMLPIAPAAAAVLIDDFASAGPLNGRTRMGPSWTVKEQFDATASARFDATGVELTCGAAAPGAAHIRGTPDGTGATFALVFSGAAADGGKPANRFDASAFKGISVRVALGDAKASKLMTARLNVADSLWDYTKDIILDRGWAQIDILWGDLTAAPAAPKPFPAAALNQLVFPFAGGELVDVYVDDVAFIP